MAKSFCDLGSNNQYDLFGSRKGFAGIGLSFVEWRHWLYNERTKPSQRELELSGYTRPLSPRTGKREAS